MNKTIYVNIVESKIKIAAFRYLKNKIKSKGKEINYGDQLFCQNYLSPNNILTFDDQKLIFAYRSRMNKLSYNYPGNKIVELCQCGVQMTNEHLYYCIVLNEGISNQDKYEKIFNGNISEQISIFRRFEHNLKTRNKIRLGKETETNNLPCDQFIDPLNCVQYSFGYIYIYCSRK